MKKNRYKSIVHKIFISVSFGMLTSAATTSGSIALFQYLVNQYALSLFLKWTIGVAIIIGNVMLLSIVSVLMSKALGVKLANHINKISRIAKEISTSDLSQRIEVSKRLCELSGLEEVLNDMIARLDKGIQKEKQFVSDASHELRTPLSIIQGYLDILNSWGKKDEKLLDESLGAITEEVKNMKHLTENLLVLARSESMKMDKRTVKINEIIDKIIHETKLTSINKKITSKRNDEAIIAIDYNLILQMIRALVDNSLKYTGESGEISIDCLKEEHSVKLIIEDNGIGIPQEELNNVFDRFYRVDFARNKEIKGSGVGLALVKSIVQLHNGSIKIESEVDKGTKVIVQLPA